MKNSFSIMLILLMSTLASIAQKKPFILGEIVELNSVELSEKRILNIYLPDGYNVDDSIIKFPVIYLLDGSSDEDFIHIAGLVQYCNFPWVDILPKSIVVGIANVDRRRDFTFPTTLANDKRDFPTTGSSQKFIKFLEKELVPYIESHYSTDTVKTIVGQSLGGLLATEILFEKPEMFTNYLIVSPSLWWDNESLLKRKSVLMDSSNQQQKNIFIAVGNEGVQMENYAKL